MLSQVIVFLLGCLSKIVLLFRKVKVDTFLSYFDFIVALNAFVIVLSLIRYNLDKVSEEQNWLRNKERNKEYNEYQGWLKRNTRGDNK